MTAAAILAPDNTPMLDLLVGVWSVACAEILRSERSNVESNTPKSHKNIKWQFNIPNINE